MHRLRNIFHPSAGNSVQTYFLLTLLIAAISVFYLTLASNDSLAGFTSDDAIYLLLADIYSFWTPPATDFYEFIRQESYFPPVYPIILGLFAGGSANLAVAGYITVISLILAILMPGAWIWRETGKPTVSIVTVLLITILPATLIYSQELWSEFLFMVFIYGALAFAAGKTISAREWLAMACLIALASFTRSAGIALAGAYCIVLLHRKIKYGYLYACLSLVPFLYWNVIREQFLDRTDYIDTASRSFFHADMSALPGIVYGKFILLFNSSLWLFGSVKTSGFQQYLGILFMSTVLVFICRGFLVRIRILKLDALFLLFYSIIICLWPYDSVYFLSRFIYPLLPLLCMYFYIGLTRIYPGKTARPLLLLIFVSTIIVIYPSSKQYIERAYLDIGNDLNPYRRGRQWLMAADEDTALQSAKSSKFLIDSLKDVGRRVPEADCIYAVQAPIVMLHTKRITGILPLPEVDEAEFFQGTSQCNYLLSMPMEDLQGKYPLYYPIRRTLGRGFEVAAHYTGPLENGGPEMYLLRRINDTSILE